MQNRSFDEHYYKIKCVTFSVLIHVGRKPVFGLNSKIKRKPGCSMKMALGLIFFSVTRKKRDCTIDAAKTKMLISCLVTTQLICAFDLANETNRFSQVAAQITDAIYQSIRSI